MSKKTKRMVGGLLICFWLSGFIHPLFAQECLIYNEDCSCQQYDDGTGTGCSSGGCGSGSCGGSCGTGNWSDPTYISTTKSPFM
ncbi:MAG TPA: hypothetical protein DC049_05210 [Spirochaetia bacterium]|nr:hypothetical protein [Spirochaetia bacterium]